MIGLLASILSHLAGCQRLHRLEQRRAELPHARDARGGDGVLADEGGGELLEEAREGDEVLGAVELAVALADGLHAVGGDDGDEGVGEHLEEVERERAPGAPTAGTRR